MTSDAGKLRRFDLVRDALAGHNERHTIAIVEFKDGRPSGLGSGTCVRVKDRFFIATAAHVIDGVQEDSICLIAGPSKDLPCIYVPLGVFRAHNNVPVIRRSPKSWSSLDIGWLEVSSSEQARLNKDFVPLDQIELGGTMVDDDLVMVSGFPVEMTICERFEQSEFGVKALHYLTHTIQKELSALGGDAAARMLLDYDRDDPSKSLPVPKGMSGGGAWRAHVSSGLWLAEHARLIGIQSAWIPPLGPLLVVQFRFWLEALAASERDLAAFIKARLELLR